MTQIGFYLLTEETVKNIQTICCQLIHKAYKQNKFIVLQTEDCEQAQFYNEYLWQFDATSFIPHANLDISHQNQTDFIYSVYLNSNNNLSYDLNKDNKEEVLINLSTQIPMFFSRFHRLIEIVSADEKDKTTSREHYKFYKSHGYPITTYDL